jgi:hypothetical protein
VGQDAAFEEGVELSGPCVAQRLDRSRPAQSCMDRTLALYASSIKQTSQIYRSDIAG